MCHVRVWLHPSEDSPLLQRATREWRPRSDGLNTFLLRFNPKWKHRQYLPAQEEPCLHTAHSKGTRVSDSQRCGWAVNSENALGFGIWRSPKAASPAAHTSVTCDGFDSVTGLSSLGHVLLKDFGPRPMRWMMMGCRALVRVKPKNSIEGNHLTELSWVSGIVPEASTKHSWWVLCSSLQLRTSRLRKPICLGAHTWEAADVRSEPRSY